MALFSLCTVMVQAEELKFVTVLSQPIGAFAQVESLNEERPSKTLFVNFCNTSVTTGEINVQGMVKMNELRLTGDSARAGSSGANSVKNYQITQTDGLEIGKGGSLAGGKLLANSANPQDITVSASTNINADSTFIAADIPSMKIGATTNIVYPEESLVGADVQWRASTEEYRYNFKVDSDHGVIKDGSTEYSSYPIRTDKRGGDECLCGSSVSPFGNKHCTAEWATEQCENKESPSERRVGTVYWRFDYGNCQWYEADPKGYESTSDWTKWQKWGTIPSHHNCQCQGYSGGVYTDSSSTIFDQQYGNPRFKSGAINGNMVNESAASRMRDCRYDKILGYGDKYDGTISGTYDFNNCKWNETANCYCSTERAGAPKAQASGTSTTVRQCSSINSKWTGEITDTYNHDNCTWSYGDESVCKCAGQPASLTKTESCPAGYTGSKTYKYNASLDKCVWELTSDTCKISLHWTERGSRETGICTSGSLGSYPGTCPSASCSGTCSTEGATCFWESCASVGANVIRHECVCKS